MLCKCPIGYIPLSIAHEAKAMMNSAAAAASPGTWLYSTQCQGTLGGAPMWDRHSFSLPTNVPVLSHSTFSYQVWTQHCHLHYNCQRTAIAGVDTRDKN